MIILPLIYTNIDTLISIYNEDEIGNLFFIE